MGSALGGAGRRRVRGAASVMRELPPSASRVHTREAVTARIRGSTIGSSAAGTSATSTVRLFRLLRCDGFRLPLRESLWRARRGFSPSSRTARARTSGWSPSPPTRARACNLHQRADRRSAAGLAQIDEECAVRVSVRLNGRDGRDPSGGRHEDGVRVGGPGLLRGGIGLIAARRTAHGEPVSRWGRRDPELLW